MDRQTEKEREGGEYDKEKERKCDERGNHEQCGYMNLKRERY
jgi:hypothetical protein